MPKRTCAFDGCATELVKKPGPGRWPKWCPEHQSRREGLRDEDGRSIARVEAGRSNARAYHLARRAPECLHCGGSLPPPSESLSSYCSRRCRGRASYERNREAVQRRIAEETARRAEARARTIKVCPVCEEEFSPRLTLAQKFCGDDCRRKAHPADSRSRTCTVEGCDRPHRAKGMCNMHYKAVLRAEGRIKNDPWSDRRRANYHARRARKAQAPSDSILPFAVFERDGWTCGICDGSIDPELSWPDPMSASLDHVIPLAAGGSHTWGNVQAAHLTCNVSKGDRLAA